jgi:hypothetical protein
MPNDFLSLWPSPRRSARLVEGTIELLSKLPLAALALVASTSLLGCGGEEDDGVTYDDDIKPIFNQRCTTCHRPVSPIQVDIQNPYAPEVGLVNAVNTWWEQNPENRDELGLDMMNVVPFDPDASFLMHKITGDLPEEGAGAQMPAQIAPLTPDEVGVLETWVTDGALPGPYFDNNVQPIFGSEDASGFFNGKCVFCHYAGSPVPSLDLTDVFGPNGLVDVDATYRGRMKRVLPGDPENSLMILKVRAERADSDIGAQMPYSFDALSSNQVETVRQWILEGARP